MTSLSPETATAGSTTAGSTKARARSTERAERGARKGAPARALKSAEICHLIASNFAGGPEKQIVELSARMRDRGHGVVVGSFKENRPTVQVTDQAAARGLTTFLIDTRSSFSPMAVRQLRRELQALAVEVLVTHGYKANLVGYLATRGTSVIQVPMIRGYTGENAKVRMYEAFDRRLLHRFERILCVSEGTRGILGRTGLNMDRIHVLHNAVECDQQVDPLDLRAEFGLPRESTVAVAAGRLSPEKGHRFLVEAMGRLAARKQTVCCLVFGSGPDKDRLQEQIHELGLSDRVRLAGFRTDVLRCLAGADLVVNPSLTEGLPNVVLEAMSLGRPVVATEVGGVGELVVPYKTGWLIGPGDASALAAAIEEAIANSSLAASMASAGRELVASKFSFSQQVRSFEDMSRGWYRTTKDGRQ